MDHETNPRLNPAQSGSGHNSGTPDIAGAVAALSARFGDRLTTGETIRQQHAHTLTWLPNEPPDAVVFAGTSDEVADIVSICSAHRAPVIPFGAGSSLEGQVNAPRGGISIDFSRMDAIVSVNAADLDCVVQAGVSRKALNDHLRDTGLFFSVDPGAEYATLGGMASTRASGTTAVRYGTMRDNVLAIKAVMADGTIINTARRARKSAAGYDLTRLLIGAEGTLGIITELTLRLHGVPETVLSAVCPFRSVDGACNAVIQAIQLGIGVARMELLDALQIKACNAYSKLTLDEVPTLFLEFHGSAAGAREQVVLFEEIAMAEGALRFDWADKEEDRRRLWKARHDAYWSVKSMWPGKDALATDVCVPISNLAACIQETTADLAEHDITAPLVGHVGDGNFHLSAVFDRQDASQVAKIEAFLERLANRALRFDGTCTGEHGIGQGKMKYLKAEHGPALNAMRAIKHALDPLDILNPGKILPAPE